MKKNILIVVVILMVIVIALVTKNNGGLRDNLTAGGGLNLKELNQKSSTSSGINMELHFNQTTRQNLEQGLVCANFLHTEKGFFVGAGAVAGVSTEIGICCPTIFINGGFDFSDFQLEYKVGKFKRSSLLTQKIDPQFSNFCLDLGEGASAANAMQFSIVKAGTKFGFGHSGKESFYKFDGNWYIYAEKTICKGFYLGGGMDFAEETTGYAAMKLAISKNMLTLTANKLGTDLQNFVLSYNRDDISVGKKEICLSASLWAQDSEQGLHLVTGLKQGSHGMLFAELGSKLYGNQFKPYCGLGATLSF